MAQLNSLLTRIVTELLGGFNLNPDNFTQDDETLFFIKHDKVLIGIPYQIRRELCGGETWYDHTWHDWQPQSDLNDAYVILERMSEFGLYWELSRSPDAKPICMFGWGSYDRHEGEFAQEFSGEGDTVGEAIINATVLYLNWKRAVGEAK